MGNFLNQFFADVKEMSKEDVTSQFIKDIIKEERIKKKNEELEKKLKKEKYFNELTNRFTKSSEGLRYVELPDYGDKKVFIFVQDHFKSEYISERDYDRLDQAKNFIKYFSFNSEEKYNLYLQEHKMMDSDGSKFDLVYLSHKPSIKKNENSIIFDFRD